MLKNKIWQLLKGKEGYSSKRFIALWSIIILVTYFILYFVLVSGFIEVLVYIYSISIRTFQI